MHVHQVLTRFKLLYVLSSIPNQYMFTYSHVYAHAENYEWYADRTCKHKVNTSKDFVHKGMQLIRRQYVR
jgi:hypothetical protein